MSTEALSATGGATTFSQLSATRRVAELEALIERTGQSAATGIVPSATQATGSETAASANPVATASSFSAALAAATGETPASTVADSGQDSQYEGLVQQAAARNGIDPALLHGLIQQESGFDASAQSSAGAAGLTQLMPGTASSLGVANPLDPAESIEGGARYLSQLMQRFGGNTTDALAAYNAGPGAVEQYGGVPPYAETQSYVTKVLGYAEGYRANHPATTAATTLGTIS